MSPTFKQFVVVSVPPIHRIGTTLMHEHIVVDYSTNFGRPAPDSSRINVGGLTLEEQNELWDKPMCCHIAGYLRCYFNQNKDNMILDDVDLMSNEIQRFKSLGGSTIVECSLDNIGRNPSALREISERTNINIIMGCGWYLDRVHPKNMDEKTVSHLAEKMISDIQQGINGIKAGLIGELGCSTVLTKNETKVLQAGVVAQKTTGATISIHPGYSKHSPTQILDILQEEGADLTRVVMGHVDRGLLDLSDMINLAKRGCVLEFDQFGWNCSFTHALSHGITYPSDFERCKTIKTLIDAGFGSQIVVSHDLAFKTRLTKYGGTGYDYITRNCVPYMKINCGITEEEIHNIFVETPKRLLTLSPK